MDSLDSRQEQGIYSSSMRRNRPWGPPASDLTVVRDPFLRVKLKQRKVSYSAELNNTCLLFPDVGTWWRSWLRHLATNWKVAGSIPVGVIGIIHIILPAALCLRSTQPLPEISTVDHSWGKGGRYVVLKTLPPSYADCLEIPSA